MENKWWYLITLRSDEDSLDGRAKFQSPIKQTGLCSIYSFFVGSMGRARTLVEQAHRVNGDDAQTPDTASPALENTNTFCKM